MNRLRYIHHGHFRGFAACATAGLVLVYLTSGWAYGHLQEYLTLREELVQLKTIVARTSHSASTFDSLQTYHRRLAVEVAKAQLDEDVGQVYDLARRAGIGSVVSFIPHSPGKQDELELLSFEIKAEGSYGALMKFVSLLETASPAYLVRRLLLEPRPQGHQGVIKGELTIERVRKA